jgi:hypothetical protein
MGFAAVSFGRWLPTFKRRNKARGRNMFLRNAEVIFPATRHNRPENSSQTKPACLIHISPHKGHTAAAAAATLETASLPSTMLAKCYFV